MKSEKEVLGELLDSLEKKLTIRNQKQGEVWNKVISGIPKKARIRLPDKETTLQVDLPPLL
jgi:ribosomal protein L31E